MRLGCDPEVFLLDKAGQFKSVIGLIGANKWNPKQIDGLPDGFTLQEDNVALEFGVPPAASMKEFVSNISTVMHAALVRLPDTRFSSLSCTVFPEKELDNPSAWVFGCEPDFNAWTGEENVKPEASNPYLRAAGGHIHVETDLDKKNVVRAMDLCNAIPSLLMDSGEQRRELYGKAGAFRPKPYGLEYRTLSNFWIFDSKLVEWAWNATAQALRFAAEPYAVEAINDRADDIQHIINTGNKKQAELYVKDWNLCLV